MPEHLNHVPQPPTGQIRCFLDLSTGHLQASDRLFLEFSADPGKRDGIIAMAETDGWLVHVHDDRCCEGISDALWGIFETTRALGCDYVLFDADGPGLGGLPMSEEEAGDEVGAQSS